MEISLATFKRDLAKLRDHLNIPVGFDKNLGGYRVELAGSQKTSRTGLKKYESYS